MVFLRRVLFAVFSLLLCLLAGEVIIRGYLGYNTVYDMEMTQYALTAKVRSDNPLIGYTNRPNTTTRLMGVPVHINSDGFRGKEYPVHRSEKARVILLGDSFTFGWGVREGDTFADILEAGLNNISPAEVFNFSTGNYNTVQEVNLFLQKGLKYRPDKVVLFYFINDAEETPKISSFWFLGHSRLISFFWPRVKMLINDHPGFQDYRFYYSGLYKQDQRGWIAAQKAFLLLRDVCQSNNIELKVILLPDLHDLLNYPFQDEQRIVLAFLREHGIEALDITPHFMGRKDTKELWVRHDDPHPGALAHKLIARYALEFIKK